jgi:oleate hydratase
MYYSSGNYEAFARPRKPEGIEKKSAYVVGTGLAGLTAACYLVRDAQMPGDHIHVLEARELPGGACDGEDQPIGFTMRGGREMDNHFEVMWDLYRSIPSIEDPSVSVLDEYYWLNKDDPNYSLCRATQNRGQDAHTDKKFALSDKGQLEVMKLFFTPDEQLFDKRINEIWDDEVFGSNFWMYWRTMFAFENWHSALEVKRYVQRYIHHIGGLPDFTALRFTRYNQYDSMILPMVRYLEAAGVSFEYGCKVVNVEFDFVPAAAHAPAKKVARAIVVERAGKEDRIPLTEDDQVYITDGGCVENSSWGSQNTVAKVDTELRPGGGWDMWRRIAAQAPDGSFGNPDKFCSNPEESNWMSATVDTADPTIISAIQRICRRDPLSGRVVTGGIVTARDSKWLLSWTINRQPQFKNQPQGHVLVWVYALFTNKEGDFVKKPMRECTGAEICQEWLYHIGIPEDQIVSLAQEGANTTTCYMPYITAFFMPRTDTDRPKVVPDGAVNFAFLGQFAEVARDTIFTTEYSMRTGMEAVYTLCNVDRGVPEVWGSVYDVRCLLDATTKLRDGHPVTEMINKMPLVQRKAAQAALGKAKGTDLEKLLKEYGII